MYKYLKQYHTKSPYYVLSLAYAYLMLCESTVMYEKLVASHKAAVLCSLSSLQLSSVE